MLLIPSVSERDNKTIVASIEGTCIGFFNRETLAKFESGKLELDVPQEFMIVGCGKRLKDNGMPTSVFLDAVGPSDKLVVAPALSCSGSMGSTSTFSEAEGILFSNCGAAYIAENNNSAFYGLPYYPTPNMEFWTRKLSSGKRRIKGLNRIVDIDRVFRATNQEFQHVDITHRTFFRVQKLFARKNNQLGLTLATALQAVRDFHASNPGEEWPLLKQLEALYEQETQTRREAS